MRSIRAALRLFGVSAATVVSWNAAAIRALRDSIINVVWMSFVLCLVALVLTGIAHTAGWMTAKVIIVVVITVIYLALLAAIATMRRSLHAAGLLLEMDLIHNLPRFYNNTTLKFKTDNGKLKVKFDLDPKFAWDFAALQFAGHWLWVLVCIELNALWFLMLIPFWGYPMAFGIMLMSGIYWIIARKPIHFEWFKWFGSFQGYFGFVGGGVYIVASYYNLHPYPIIPAAIAGAAVMLANQHQWWVKWHGLTKPAAIVIALLLLIAPYVGVVEETGNMISYWNWSWQADSANTKALQEQAKPAIGLTKERITQLEALDIERGLTTVEQTELVTLRRMERRQENIVGRRDKLRRAVAAVDPFRLRSETALAMMLILPIVGLCVWLGTRTKTAAH